MSLLDASGAPLTAGATMGEKLSEALKPLVVKYAAENHLRELVVLIMITGVKSAKELGLSREQIYSLTRQVFDGDVANAARILQ